jgi:tRNA(Ile)-lysidine synthase
LALCDDDFNGLMNACPAARAARRVAVGVSGGADSMALCLLVDAWARRRGVAVTALTVDHGLRPEAAAEARQVGRWLAARGIDHAILSITAPRPSAGLQRVARGWRFSALDTWCRDHAATSVLLAHNAEDQAETLWMRVLADSGPDGLRAMTAETRVAGMAIARPLLPIAKSRLIATCHARGQSWIEDPSNRRSDFTRVRLRDLAPALRDTGLDPGTASRFSTSMGAARRVIDRHCADFIKRHGGVSVVGVIWFDGVAFAALPPPFADLLLSRVLQAVGGGALPPRRKRVARLREGLCSGPEASAKTLAGCIIARRKAGRGVAPDAGRFMVFREPTACADPVLLTAGRRTRWDNRFEVISKTDTPVRIGALGEAGWRWLSRHGPDTNPRTGLARLPHAARLSHPAIHELDGSVSVPHFEDCTGSRRMKPTGSLDIRFCPDSDWIRMLAAPGWHE